MWWNHDRSGAQAQLNCAQLTRNDSPAPHATDVHPLRKPPVNLTTRGTQALAKTGTSGTETHPLRTHGGR